MNEDTEYHLNELVNELESRLNHKIYNLESRIKELEYKVQQLDYYKASEHHTHPEYERSRY